MSVATAIINARNKIAAAFAKVAERGGTIPATQNLANLPSAIDSIPSGGGEVIEEKEVNFIDHTGAIIAAYTLEEAAQLSSFPTPIEYDGLRFVRWNFTDEEFRNYVAEKCFFNVGALYTTTDTFTHIFIEVKSGETFYVQPYGEAWNGNEYVDWGDGSEITTADRQVVSHTYNVGGRYEVIISSDLSKNNGIHTIIIPTNNSNGITEPIPIGPGPIGPGGEGNGSDEVCNITIELENITYGEQGKCTVYLYENASGYVYFYIGNTMTSTLITNSSKVVFTYPAKLDVGTYDVLVKVQDKNYNVTATGSFIVNPKNIDFNVNFDELFTGYEITGTVDTGGIPGILRLSINPGTLAYTCHIDEDGEFIFTSNSWPFWAGKYNNAQMFFVSDDNNYEGMKNISFIINPIDMEDIKKSTRSCRLFQNYSLFKFFSIIRIVQKIR